MCRIKQVYHALICQTDSKSHQLRILVPFVDCSSVYGIAASSTLIGLDPREPTAWTAKALLVPSAAWRVWEHFLRFKHAQHHLVGGAGNSIDARVRAGLLPTSRCDRAAGHLRYETWDRVRTSGESISGFRWPVIHGA